MKIDFKKTLPSYQTKHNQFTIIELPPLQYLMVDGHGDPNNELKMIKKHHEIYFSDFRKVTPDKLRTILRQPVV